MNNRIDPVLVTIINKKLEAITREMGIALTRTTSSPFFNSGDICTGIMNETGDILCQAEYLPLLAYTFPPQVKSIIKFFGNDIYPGDLFIHNDPFYGCNQLQDLAVLKPVFIEGNIQFWTGAKGHEIDLGGPTFGGYNSEATDIWQETIRIPPLRIHSKGVMRRDVWNLVLENSRVPTLLSRDIQAQIGGCNIGERGLQSIAKEYTLGLLKAHIGALLDSTERRMRAEISQMKPGTYESVSFVNDVASSETKLHQAKLRVIIGQDSIALDFSGTDPQTSSFANGVYATTYAAAISVLFQCVDPDMPHNAGAIRPIEVIVPDGCILNAKAPAATVLGNFCCDWLVGDSMMRALSNAIPQSVTAGWSRRLTASITGIDPRTGAQNHDILFTIGAQGGAGATYSCDGYPALGMLTAHGIISQDYELYEIKNPHIITETGYRKDSGGAGRWRGGLGVFLKVKLYNKPPYHIASRGDNSIQAFGLFGGSFGMRNELRIISKEGNRVEMKPNANIECSSQTVLEILTGGGGGYGDPELRDPKSVEYDVLNEFVSPESAKDVYKLSDKVLTNLESRIIPP